MTWLLKNRVPELDFVIFDDGSDKTEVHTVLRRLIQDGVRTYFVSSSLPRKTHRDRAARCALLRRSAVDLFLETPGYDYLVWKDDDVLVSSTTVLEALQDFEFLQSTDYARIGALTLHGFSTHGEHVEVEDKVFVQLQITGEANVVFSRSALMKVGNHLSTERGGFADTQFNAIRSGGLRYYDRVWRPYAIQHLGIGTGGSVVHASDIRPFWVREPYRVSYRKRPEYGQLLQVPGFNVQKFFEQACVHGGEEASRSTLTTVKS
jgi:hypothetical protein